MNLGVFNRVNLKVLISDKLYLPLNYIHSHLSISVFIILYLMSQILITKNGRNSTFLRVFRIPKEGCIQNGPH